MKMPFTKKQLRLLEYSLEHSDAGLAADYVNSYKDCTCKASIYDYAVLLAYIKEQIVRLDKNSRKKIKIYYE